MIFTCMLQSTRNYCTKLCNCIRTPVSSTMYVVENESHVYVKQSKQITIKQDVEISCFF